MPRVLAASLTGLAVLVALAGCLACRQQPDPRVAEQATVRPADSIAAGAGGRVWFLGETTLPRPDGPVPVASDAEVFVFNPGSEPLRARLFAYREAAPPVTCVFEVGPGRLEAFDLNGQPTLPRDETLALMVTGDHPLYAQFREMTRPAWELVPETLSAASPVAGPLDPTVTRWIFPDGFQGGTADWYEQETLVLLNPGARGARTRLTFHFRDGRPSREHVVVVGPERIEAVRLWELFERPAGTGRDAVVDGDYAVLVEADQPIASWQARRARWRGDAHVRAVRRAVPLAKPVVDRAPRWYYAGGWVEPLAVLPQDGYADRTWQLLFTHNAGGRASGARLTVHDGRGRTASTRRLALGGGRSDLQWLHAPAWTQAGIPLRAPWGLTLEPDHPAAPVITAAEFGSWSRAMPGAMAATSLTPGPLASEREWWLGIAEHGGDDGSPAEWHAAWQILNPAPAPLTVTLEFAGLDRGVQSPAREPARVVRVVPGGAVIRITGADVPHLARHVPFVTIARAERPFVAHAWTRLSVRGVPGTRALGSQAGVAVDLTP